QPNLLLKEQLITDSDFSGLAIDLLLPDIASFKFEWMNLLVDTNRLTASTTLASPMPEPVRDFAIDFSRDISTGPITSMGINTDFHFQVEDNDKWHNIGHTLVPKEALCNKITREPGMQSVAIKSKRDDNLDGYIVTKVEPSI